MINNLSILNSPSFNALFNEAQLDIHLLRQGLAFITRDNKDEQTLKVPHPVMFGHTGHKFFCGLIAEIGTSVLFCPELVAG